MTAEVPNLENGTPKRPEKFFGVRHVQALLYFLMSVVTYSMRTNLSVGIVAMTDSTTSPNPKIPTYNWDDKSVILSSFYWGYIIPQLFAGQTSRIYGPKWFLVAAMLFNSLACMLIPVVAANLGSQGVMACRILQGFAQGFQFPAMHHLLGQWAPAAERSRISSFMFSGVPLGTIVGMLVTGVISASWAGWPASFYVFGSLGFAWILAWIILGANSPSEHKSISDEERKYIEASLNSQENQNIVTPWGAIFTSVPFWAIIVGNLGYNWGYATLLTEIPNYMNKVMGFDMQKNSFLSSAPYLVFWLLCYVGGPVADYLMNSETMSRGGVRKLFNSLGTVIPAAALVWLSFVPDDQTALSVTLLIIAVGISSATFCGFLVNHIDLSPNHAGVLMGITNGVGNVFSMIAPLVVHAVVTDETDKSLWRIIFLVAASIYLASAVFYACFASGEIQSWNRPDDNAKTNKNMKGKEEETRM